MNWKFHEAVDVVGISRRKMVVKIVQTLVQYVKQNPQIIENDILKSLIDTGVIVHRCAIYVTYTAMVCMGNMPD